MEITRGTTPIIMATIQDNVDMSNITSVWLTITEGTNGNKKIILDKEIEDVIISGNIISCPLSQDDTLSLTAGAINYIQIRFRCENENAYATQRDFVSVLEIDKDGVIT